MAACKPPYSMRTRTSPLMMARSIRSISRPISWSHSEGWGSRAQLASTLSARPRSSVVRTTTTTSIPQPRSQSASQSSRWRGTPGAERRRGLVARIDVDEDGALGVKRDREPERAVAPEVPGRSPVDPPGQEPALDAERLEGGHLLRLGREPRQLGMIEHVVEREAASHEHFSRRDPASADVPHAERPVDPAPVDPASMSMHRTVQPFAAIRRLACDSLSTTLRGGIRLCSAMRPSASAGPHMPGLDPNCHGDADEALRIASGCIPGAHGPEAVDVRPAGGGLSQPGASAPSWPIPDAGGGLSGPGVHRACSRAQVAPVPSRGNAPRNSSPNRTEADR